jgi:tRNA(Ile)-lysidine synthase
VKDPLDGRFIEIMHREPAPGRGDGILVACSGGSDSSALALLCSAWAPREGWRVRLVHFDHGLRPGSEGEAQIVADLADQIACEFVSEALPVEETLAEEGGNLEQQARRLRYEALDRIARESRSAWVLTGHNAEDLSETLWLWILRGSGLRGLAPLPARRPLRSGSPVTLLRPLLEFRRDELQAYLRERGIAWFEDPSNQDLDLRRNRVRHRLLPRIKEEFGLDPVPAAARLGRQAGELARFLDEELARRGVPVIDLLETGAVLDRTKLRELHPVLAAWFLAGELQRLGEPNEDAVERILAMNRAGATGKSLDLPGGLQARFDDQALILIGRSDEAAAPDDLPLAQLPEAGLRLPETGEVFLDEGWILRISLRPAPLDPPDGKLRAVFDAAELALPLRLTRVQPGQRYRPLGGPGSRKLSDLFVDRKIPRAYRERVPVLLDAAGEVLWILGVARGEGAPLSESTQSGLCLDLERPSS